MVRLSELGAAGRLPREKRDLRLALVAICLVGILAVTAVAEMFSISRTTTEYQGALETSVEQRSEVRRSLLGLVETVSSARGYLLTGKEQYLESYAATRAQLEAGLADLPTHFTDDSQQHARAVQLGVTIRSRLEQLADILEEHAGSGRPVPIIDGENADAAFRTTTAAQSIANEMISVEEGEIGLGSEAVRERLRRSQLVTVVALVSIIVLVAAVALAGVSYLYRRALIEQQLIEARAMAEAANQAKSDFLAMISHEIRTPLTSILGYTELLLDDNLAPSQWQFLDRLQMSGAGLLALIDDLLDVSKIEAGEMSLDSGTLSLRAMIDDALAIISVDARTKNLSLVSDIDPAVPDRIIADRFRLRQVLLNLLKNAVKFTDQGLVTLRAREAVDPSGERLIRFEICDTGSGIPAEMHDKLFQWFSQVDTSMHRKHGGTGLGLAISRKLVLLMGGEIGVESELGLGSVFWFTTPLRPADADGNEASAGHARAIDSAGRILLVEDSPQNQELVRTILGRAGYHVDVVGDGEQALTAVQGAAYDLVLMDAQMPRMDGTEATRRIRRLGGAAGAVPIVALTANVLPDQVEALRQAGMSDYVGKPFTKAALIEAVRRWLSSDEPTGQGFGKPTVHDPAVLDEFRQLMGNSFVAACLERLKDNAGALLEREIPGPGHCASLKRRAHRIVSDAGQLGFPDLSQRSAELERAIATDQDVQGARGRARRAAVLACREMDRLLLAAGQEAPQPSEA